METYFVVLQLPGSKELMFDDNDAMRNEFWAKAAEIVRNGDAKVICVRQDTGVSEDIHNHVAECADFKTYLLLHLELSKEDFQAKEKIYYKASELLKIANHEQVVDYGEKFQLLSRDHIDINDLKVYLSTT